MAVSDMAVMVAGVRPRSIGWLRSPAWDLTFVSLSAVLVPLPLALYTLLMSLGLAADDSGSVVDAMVALLIGGPHMYATFTRTLADPQFRVDHRHIVATSLLIPIGVISIGLAAFPVLLTLFYLWASVHVLHQIAYLVECYARRGVRQLSGFDRGIDYAVVFTSLYPLALYRMVHGTFVISGVALPFPDAVRHDWVVWIAFLLFGAALTLFLARTIREFRRGDEHWPKLLLIAITVSVAFVLPAAERLDMAFQGFNAWHSFQYLGLSWFALRLARERRQVAAPLIQRLTGPGGGWRFYTALVLCTLAAVGLIGILMLLREPLGLTRQQPYYFTVLSFLLVHYYHDHVLFARPEALM
jgi:hypothetical protein